MVGVSADRGMNPVARLLHPSLLKARLRRRATCRLASSATLSRSGSITNLQPNDDAITVGPHSQIDGALVTFSHGGRIAIGEWCYIGQGARLWSGKSIEIGNYVIVAHNVSIMDDLTHPLDAKDRRIHTRTRLEGGQATPTDLGGRPVVLEDDVWIAAGATILRGVTIGARSIVSAGAVVRRDIPPDSIVAGNPAHVVRQITPTKTQSYVD
jgi:acetyltransferase-like isoleucine patch superfamily enzyme